MKISELKSIIKEELRKVLKENAQLDTMLNDYNKYGEKGYISIDNETNEVKKFTDRNELLQYIGNKGVDELDQKQGAEAKALFQQAKSKLDGSLTYYPVALAYKEGGTVTDKVVYIWKIVPSNIGLRK